MNTLEQMIFNLKLMVVDCRNMANESTRSGRSRSAKYAMVGLQVDDIIRYITACLRHSEFDNTWIAALDATVKEISAMDALNYKAQNNIEDLTNLIRGLFKEKVDELPETIVNP